MHTGVYLSLGSTNITTNNTEILITDIGDDVGDGRPSLICHTDLVACCTPSETMAKGIGLWRYPNGTRVPGESGASRPYVSLRNGQSIKLARRESLLFSPPLSPTGSYCCTIPTNEGVMMFCANLGEWFCNLGFHPQSDSVSSCVPVSPCPEQWNSFIQPLNTGSEHCGHLHL